MHNNYYLITQLYQALQEKLRAATLTACFSQSKEELILEFLSSQGEAFYIRAHFRSNFSCVSFPQSFSRAKKNSIDIFPELIDQKVSFLQG